MAAAWDRSRCSRIFARSGGCSTRCPSTTAGHPDGGGLDAIVLEVTNTPWGERHWYVFDARGGAATARTAKAMHVSPFLPMDLDYRVTWTDPGAALWLRIEAERGGVKIFEADLALTPRAARPHLTVSLLWSGIR